MGLLPMMKEEGVFGVCGGVCDVIVRVGPGRVLVFAIRTNGQMPRPAGANGKVALYFLLVVSQCFHQS